jgi:hypothetical protein
VAFNTNSYGLHVFRVLRTLSGRRDTGQPLGQRAKGRESRAIRIRKPDLLANLLLFGVEGKKNLHCVQWKRGKNNEKRSWLHQTTNFGVLWWLIEPHDCSVSPIADCRCRLENRWGNCCDLPAQK